MLYPGHRPKEFKLELNAEIRPCSEADLPLLEWDGLFFEHREIFQDVFQRQKRGETVMLVCAVNSYPAGQIWIDFVRDRAQGAGYLWAFRVMAPFQKLGLGRRLIQRAEAILAERGYSAARLAVETHNLAAQRFYERAGYHRIGDVDEHYAYRTPDGVMRRGVFHEFLLEKELPAATVHPDRKECVRATPGGRSFRLPSSRSAARIG